MFKLSQETIAIVTFGLTLVGLGIASYIHIRTETQAIRAEIQTVQTEARAERQEAYAERQVIRKEARADREFFQKHIVRLTREQGRLDGIVDQMRTTGR